MLILFTSMTEFLDSMIFIKICFNIVFNIENNYPIFINENNKFNFDVKHLSISLS
jgi:hypothetical protein